jgi:hypothetical protein
MFTIFRHIEGGEPMEVAMADTREAAEKRMTRMRKLFPADQYELREASADEGSPPP